MIHYGMFFYHFSWLMMIRFIALYYCTAHSTIEARIMSLQELKQQVAAQVSAG